MRVVLEHDNGEVWACHEIDGATANSLLACLTDPPTGDGDEIEPARSLIDDLRAGSLAQVARQGRGKPRMAGVGFTQGELILLRDALESYWFDCSQAEDERLERLRPSVEALQARVDRIRDRMSPG